MRIICSSEDEGHRVDVVISRYVPFTRSQVKSKVSIVYVNGQVKNFGYKVKKGDIIEFEDIEPEKIDLEPEPIKIEILYQDDDIAIINKPHNMVVHPAPGHWTGTLVNAILHNLKDKLSTSGGYLRPGIVHRLDKETSGVMVIALNDKAHYKLANLFKNKLVQKEYWAIVHGRILEKSFTVKKAIARNPNNRLKMIVSEKGKEATTEFELISSTEKFSLVIARPITGRTHQIRVHLKSVSHPIVGDPLYGFNPKMYISMFNLPEGFIPLVAKKLVFPHPIRDEIMYFEIELPEEFVNLAKTLSLI
ncbi:MAG: RluA family pseudouridine synthase [Brevinematia bacterium]